MDEEPVCHQLPGTYFGIRRAAAFRVTRVGREEATGRATRLLKQDTRTDSACLSIRYILSDKLARKQLTRLTRRPGRPRQLPRSSSTARVRGLISLAYFHTKSIDSRYCCDQVHGRVQHVFAQTPSPPGRNPRLSTPWIARHGVCQRTYSCAA